MIHYESGPDSSVILPLAGNMNVSLPRYPLAEREGYKLPQIEACMLRFGLALLVVLSVASAARAGLYYSGETFAELPSRWRGFLLDQRTLRNLAVKPKADSPVSPTRHRYEEAAAALEKARRDRALTADETADLGAVFLRLGEVNKALDILRSGQRQHPQHFRSVSNLGTAWQLREMLLSDSIV